MFVQAIITKHHILLAMDRLNRTGGEASLDKIFRCTHLQSLALAFPGSMERFVVDTPVMVGQVGLSVPADTTGIVLSFLGKLASIH